MKEVDKVQQAERKLQGLCQLCGSKASRAENNARHPYVDNCDYSHTGSYDAIPEQCLDWICWNKDSIKGQV